MTHHPPVGAETRFLNIRPGNNIQQQLADKSLSFLPVVPCSGSCGHMCCGRGTGLSPTVAVNVIVVVIVDVDILEKEIDFLLFCGGVLVASNGQKTQKKNVTVSTL